MYKTTVYLFVLLITCRTYAQPDSLWSRTYGGAHNDECYAIQQTSDGGYVLGGASYSAGGGLYNFSVIKTDANGNQQWSRTFGDNAYDVCLAVEQTSDGGYAFAGYTASFGNGQNFWLIKTNANGDSLWSRTYGGLSNDDCSDMQQTSDGGYIMAGTTSFGNGYEDFWLVKADANGNMEWSRTFGEAGVDQASAVQQTSDGGYAIAGTWDPSGGGDYDILLAKVDASGNDEWSYSMGGGIGLEECYDMLQTSDDGYALLGHQNYDRLIVKLGENGAEEWNQTYETNSAFGFSFVQTNDGGYALGGYTYVGVEHADFWMTKMDAAGNEEWYRTFGGTGDDGVGNDFGRKILLTNDAGYALAGYTRSFDPAGYYDMWLIKVEPEPWHAPENLVISAIDSDIHLRWNSVDVPSVSYQIYSDTESEGLFQNLVGTTSDTIFVHDNATEEPDVYKFYVVKAVRP